MPVETILYMVWAAHEKRKEHTFEGARWMCLALHDGEAHHVSVP
jgi:hypothetical protein